jgi:gamma-glutamyltranspeptidase/glutathione hydrolase
VAAGHPATVAAATDVLAVGGNAVDACVAAGFAAAVAEPCLTSLGGGGFLLAHLASGDDVVVDFFVDTPGVGLPPRPSPAMTCVTVQFPGSAQDFHVGGGSVAVPGCLAGYLHAHRRFGRVDLDVVVAPARHLAAEGIVLNEWQGYLFGLLEPILTFTPAAAGIFAPSGRLLCEGDRFVNPELAAFLTSLDERGFAVPSIADATAIDVDASGGLLTSDDLLAYRVIEREPVVARYRDATILTNPPPSFGGALVALGLQVLADEGPAAPWGSAARAVQLTEAMVEQDAARVGGDAIARLRRLSTRGTTHISVADADGNVATMTTSNGEGSGVVAPGTGVLLNNMLGEDDLHPAGFHAAPPGERVASMMAPTIVLGADGEPLLAAGTGGSARIRTALLQVVAAAVDEPETSLDELVERPRQHWDGSIVQIEPGMPHTALAALAERWPTNVWDEPNLYFGGVHAVRPGLEAAGDPRRGGAAAMLDH